MFEESWMAYLCHKQKYIYGVYFSTKSKMCAKLMLKNHQKEFHVQASNFIIDSYQQQWSFSIIGKNLNMQLLMVGLQSGLPTEGTQPG